MKSSLGSFLLLSSLLLSTPAGRASLPADFSHLPGITLWAWQVPESMEFIDPRQVAVAYLDQTVMVRTTVQAEPRFQPLRLPSGTQVHRRGARGNATT